LNFSEAYSVSNMLFLLHGLGLTMLLAAFTIVVSLVCGTIVGFLRYTRLPVVSQLARLYVEGTRSLPPLLIIFFTYFALPDIGIKLSPMIAAVLALSVYGTSLISEVVRGGLNSIEKGQIEAARSQGFTYLHTMWEIVLPQAMKRMIPPLVGQSIILIKNTSYAMVIGIEELTRSGQLIYSSNVRVVFPIIILVALIYFVINYCLSVTSRKFEKRFSA
jgi:putative glutamine transport system permease protein